MAPATEPLPHPRSFAPAAGARDRSLRRQLVKADIVAGCASGAAALLAGVGLAELPIVAFVIALGWPLVAGACGLYTVSPLRTWASGVGEAPRLAVTSLLISWPVFGLLSSFGALRPVLGALSASA